MKPDLFAAYVAGFFDGEGSVNAYLLAGWMRIELSLFNTHFEALVAVQARYGGNIVKRAARNAEDKGYRKSWKWTVTGPLAEQLIRDVLPYSIVKRQQLELALKLRTLTLTKREVALRRRRQQGDPRMVFAGGTVLTLEEKRERDQIINEIRAARKEGV